MVLIAEGVIKNITPSIATVIFRKITGCLGEATSNLDGESITTVEGKCWSQLYLRI